MGSRGDVAIRRLGKGLLSFAKVFRGLLVVLRVQLDGFLEAYGGRLRIARSEQGYTKIIVGARLIHHLFKRFQCVDITLSMDIGHTQIVMYFR